MRKYKINTMHTAPSDKEISKFKDFQVVVSKYKSVLFWKKITIGLFGGGGLALVIGTSIYLTNSPEVRDQELITTNNNEVELKVDGPNLQPALEDINDGSEIMDIENNSESEETVSGNVVEKGSKEVLKESNDITEGENINSDRLEPGPIVDNSFIKAHPLVGFDSLYNYLQERMILPENISDSLGGKVIVSFVIDTLGNPKDIQIVEGLNNEIDKEVKKLIQGMPPWAPAKLNGKPVQTTLSIPIQLEVIKEGNKE